MAEPGDPKPPETPGPEVDHDAGVGFASASSLQGRSRHEPEPQADPELEPEPGLGPDPDVALDPPTPAPDAQPEPDPGADPVAAQPTEPAPMPAWAIETPRPAPAYAGFGSRREPSAEVEGGLSLFTVYALILFAVPTLGVSALVALLAVLGRSAPQDPLAASHFVFQKRTLWIGAVAAVLGAVLIVVGLGVFVLFALAVWLILRGAAGVLKLKAGRAIPNPRAWLT